MEAMDLAREVVTYSQRRDRPSSLVLVVYDRTGRGIERRDEKSTMRITAPIENGRLIFRVSFPQFRPPAWSNSIPTGAPAVERIVLEYDGSNNLEGAAACIEGHMTHRLMNNVMLFNILEGGVGGLGPDPLAMWSLSFGEERGNKTTARLQIIQQMLRSLLVG